MSALIHPKTIKVDGLSVCYAGAGKLGLFEIRSVNDRS